MADWFDIFSSVLVFRAGIDSLVTTQFKPLYIDESKNEDPGTQFSVTPVKYRRQFFFFFLPLKRGEKKIGSGFHLILIPFFHPPHVSPRQAGVCSGFISRVHPDTCGDDMYEGREGARARRRLSCSMCMLYVCVLFRLRMCMQRVASM